MIKAEAYFTQFSLEHNIPYNALDRFTDIVKKMFPDSKIAAEYSCHRKKTTAIAKTLGEDMQGESLSLEIHILHKNLKKKKKKKKQG